MKQILYIPLDERPCNLDYPLRMMKDNHVVKVNSISKSMLGRKKKPGRIEEIRKYVFDHVKSADGIF